MMIKSVKEKPLRLDLRRACLIISYFQLMVLTLATLWLVYTILTVPLSLTDPDVMKKLMEVLILGELAFPISLSFIKFTIILLIGLHRRSRIFIRIYLFFSLILLCLSTTTCFVFEYVFYKDLSVGVVILIHTLSAYFTYSVWRYWIQLDPKNMKVTKQTV